METVKRRATKWAMRDYSLQAGVQCDCHAWRTRLAIAAVKKEEGRAWRTRLAIVAIGAVKKEEGQAQHAVQIQAWSAEDWL